MKTILCLLLALAPLSGAATKWALTKNVDGTTTFPSVTAALNSSFELDGSGNLVLRATSTYATAASLSSYLTTASAATTYQPIGDYPTLDGDNAFTGSAAFTGGVGLNDGQINFGAAIDQVNFFGGSGTMFRTALGLGTLATQSGTFSGTHSGTSSGTNTGDQDLSGKADLSGATFTGNVSIPANALSTYALTVADEVNFNGSIYTYGGGAAAAHRAALFPATGVSTALGVNIGSAGAVQLNNGSGAGLTALNATQLTSGTVPDARLTTSSIGGNAATATALSMSGGATMSGSSGAATITASGTNQHINLTPSGTGRVLIVSSSGDSFLTIGCANGFFTGLRLQEGGNDRWTWAKDATSDDMVFSRFNSSGIFQNNPLSVSSSSGNVSVANALAVTSTTTATGGLILPTSTTPASASATGTTGTVCWDSSYIYVCTATNTWKRVAIATW